MAETLAEALEREHGEIDAGIEAFTSGWESGTTDTDALTRAMDALRRHIYLEEELLFPPLREAGMAMPVFVMLREHGEMWTTLDALQRDVADGAVGPATVKACQELIGQLAAHNGKEEQILYAQADAVLSGHHGDRLRDFIAAARLPDGWVCERARV